MPRRKKPANAKWLAKTKVDIVDPAIDYPPEDGQGHAMSQVEVAWYSDGRVKLTLPQAAPAVISQAYLTGPGQDIIIEIEHKHSSSPAPERQPR